MADGMATLKDIRDYFGMTSTEMSREWKAMTEQDRTDIKTGIGNGTLTY